MEAKSRVEKISTRQIVLVGMFVAFMTVVSQISLPMPTGVPITIQAFGVVLTGVILGWKMGLMVTLVYILVGAVGMPVFSNFRGGMSVLAGMTGGYILGWPFLAALSGIRPKLKSKAVNIAIVFLGVFVGLAIMEGLGGLQWAFLAGDMTIQAVFIYSFAAFIPKDILLCILAIIVGNHMRKILVKGGMLN